MMHDDLQMMRQLEMEKCFLDGQIPCRWVPDLAYGFGFPLFNFYPPLPYLIGQLFRLIGLSFVETVKMTFSLSIFLSGAFMYLFAKRFFGRVGGLLSAIFYIWAPYHSVDVYVRGAMNESWALVWFPLIMYSTTMLLQSEKFALKKILSKKFLISDSAKYMYVLIFSWAALFLSHNLMVLIFTPVFAVFTFFLLISKKAWDKVIILAVSGLWALGIAAFFTIPALLENKFTQVETVLTGYYDYSAHFVSIGQLLLSRFWGYGPSVWGVESDGMPFQIGHLHWILSLIILGAIALVLLKKRKKILPFLLENEYIMIAVFFIFVGWTSAFMTHQRSAPIYQLLKQLKYLQFPWRFLTITTFAFSFVVGIIPGVLAKWKLNRNLISKILITPEQVGIALLLGALLMVINWNYFRPDGGRNGAVTDEAKFSGLAWELQQTSGIYDYLPKTAKIAPNGPRKYLTDVMSGDALISGITEGTNWATFNAEVISEFSQIRINILDFPDWRIFVDGNAVEKFIPDEEQFGRIWINLPKGSYQIYAKLYNTQVRTVSNIVTLFSLGAIIVCLYLRKKFR